MKPKLYIYSQPNYLIRTAKRRLLLNSPTDRTFGNRAEDGDIHYNSLYDPVLKDSLAVFYIDIEHYRATRETGNINGQKYSVSGVKDIITMTTGGVLLQTSSVGSNFMSSLLKFISDQCQEKIRLL